VTGGLARIGRAIAERLAADGAIVAVHYGHDESAAQETVARIEGVGGRAFAVHAELGVDGDVDTLFTGLERGLAGRPLDILVTTPRLSRPGRWRRTPRSSFDRLFAVTSRRRTSSPSGRSRCCATAAGSSP